MSFSDAFANLRDEAAAWCSGRMWFVRAPLLAYLAYAGFRNVFDPEAGTIFSGITFGIHELGHVLFSAFGEFNMVAGGTFTQLAVPLTTVFLFLRQKEYFGMAVGGAWVSFSLCDMATYLGDARAQALPLYGLSDDPQHDWHYLLSTMHLLNFDTKIALLIRCFACLILIGSLAWGGWLCFKMATNQNPQT